MIRFRGHEIAITRAKLKRTAIFHMDLDLAGNDPMRLGFRMLVKPVIRTRPIDPLEALKSLAFQRIPEHSVVRSV